MRQLDTENADRNLTSQVTVLTDTPDASNPCWCMGLVYFGDGTKNLDGTGGDFELTVTVGGQTVEPDPQTVTFSTAVRTAVFTLPFPVPANAEVLLKAKSPNAGDSDVDVTAYLYDIGPLQPSTRGRSAGIESDGHMHADLKEWLGVAPLALASQMVQADLTAIHGSALTETSGGYLAAAFVKLFDVQTPLLVASAAMRGTDSAALASVCTEARLSELDAGTGGKMANQVDEIRTDTEDLQSQIGTAGAGLTAVPWNSNWDAEVQSECTDALNAYDPPTNAEMVARTLAAADYFDPSADTVANVTLVATTTAVTNAVTTDEASRTASKADVSGLPTAAEIKTAMEAAGSHLALILADTGTDGVKVSDVKDGAMGAAAVADIFSTTTIAEAYAADGAAGTVAQLLYLILQRLNEFAITDNGDGTSTLTVKKLDGSTTAYTLTLNGDADTDPTSSTRAT